MEGGGEPLGGGSIAEVLAQRTRSMRGTQAAQPPITRNSMMKTRPAAE